MKKPKHPDSEKKPLSHHEMSVKGGQNRALKLTKKQRDDISKKGVEAWQRITAEKRAAKALLLTV